MVPCTEHVSTCGQALLAVRRGSARRPHGPAVGMVAWTGLPFNHPFGRRGRPDIIAKTLQKTHLDSDRAPGPLPDDCPGRDPRPGGNGLQPSRKPGLHPAPGPGVDADAGHASRSTRDRQLNPLAGPMPAFRGDGVTPETGGRGTPKSAATAAGGTGMIGSRARVLRTSRRCGVLLARTSRAGLPS